MLQHRLMSVAAATEVISSGAPCCVAGDEAMLRRLPRGCWVGGTIPYFMSELGGTCSHQKVFVSTLPGEPSRMRIVQHSRSTLPSICSEAPDHGYTLLLMPAFSTVLQAFAEEAPAYDEMYLRPLFGWVSGVHLDELGKRAPLVFNGLTGEVHADAALALHAELPPTTTMHIDIVNPFQQQTGPVIELDRGGFLADSCRVGGRAENLHDFLLSINHDIRLPLVADYCGALVNVSIRQLHAKARQVEFYTPVFPGIAYRAAAPVSDYVAAFATALADHRMPGKMAFACNCALNHVYGDLDGRQLEIHGPATFGEIAYLLLNQTLIHVSLVEAPQEHS